jgi:hypothetical protein
MHHVDKDGQDKNMVTEIVIEEDNSEGSEKSDFKDSEIW